MFHVRLVLIIACLGLALLKSSIGRNLRVDLIKNKNLIDAGNSILASESICSKFFNLEFIIYIYGMICI